MLLAFASAGPMLYTAGHARKPLELPPEVARDFVRDMKAFFKAKGHEADAIAAMQLHALKQHYSGKLKPD